MKDEGSKNMHCDGHIGQGQSTAQFNMSLARGKQASVSSGSTGAVQCASGGNRGGVEPPPPPAQLLSTVSSTAPLCVRGCACMVLGGQLGLARFSQS